MTTKHTPGPWEVYFAESWPFKIIIRTKDKDILTNERIAFSSFQKTRKDCRNAVGFNEKEKQEVIEMVAEQEANARLIAASPDLLEVLKKVQKFGSGLLGKEIDKAIAKAEVEK